MGGGGVPAGSNGRGEEGKMRTWVLEGGGDVVPI